MDVAWACPACRAPLEQVAPGCMLCPAGGCTYRRHDGIWRFLTPEKAAYYGPFVADYECVRRQEAWGNDDRAYYRALPFKDLSGRYPFIWQIRTRTYRALLAEVVQPLAQARGRPLHMLDLGAGNGWLSYRLAQQGHRVAAVDLSTDCHDGLGAHRWYGTEAAFVPVQATFEELPWCPDIADLVIFGGSIHYAIDYEATLRETLRVLRRDGRVVIMDSPTYHDPGSGAEMTRERQVRFREQYNIPHDALPHENYLTFDRLEELATLLGLSWRAVEPFYGWRWALQPWLARLRGRREPARFILFVGRQTQ